MHPSRGPAAGEATLRALAEAMLRLYGPAVAHNLLNDALRADDPMHALIRLANRVIARDHGLAAASDLLRAATRAVQAA